MLETNQLHQDKNQQCALFYIGERSDLFNSFLSVTKGSKYSLNEPISPQYGLFKTIEACNPDVLLVDMDRKCQHLHEQICVVASFFPRPIIAISSDPIESDANEYIRLGVTAFIPKLAHEQNILVILDLAVARFNEIQTLKAQLRETQTKLDQIQVLDKAKKLLMKRSKLSEKDAYRTLRTCAMNTNQKIESVAKALIDASLSTKL